MEDLAASRLPQSRGMMADHEARMIAAMLILQAAGPLDGVAPLDFRLLPPPRCASRPDEIVVCARDPATDRIRPAERYPSEDELALPRAEMRVLGNGTLSADVDGRMMPDGSVSRRAMVRLKLPF